MPDIPSKYLKDAGGTPPFPSLKELWVAMVRPAEATATAVAYVRTHPELVERFRELGLIGPLAPDEE